MCRIVFWCQIFVAVILFTACSVPPDYSSVTGKKMFPRSGIAAKRFSLREVDPAALKITNCEDVQVYEYTVPLNKTVLSKGYLFESIKSDMTGRKTTILFGHWLGGAQNMDSSEWEFFNEAVRYASKGYVCAIPSGSFPWMTGPTGTEKDRDLIKQQVAEYRAALDLLWSRPGTAARQALLVGHDYGAMFAILTAAADERIEALVVMAPVSRFWKWNRIIKPIGDKEKMKQYQLLLNPYDPVSLIGDLNIPTLFQYAKRDQYVDDKDALELYEAAEQAQKTILWYGGSHSLNRHEPATTDREKWIHNLLDEWESDAIR